MKKKIFLGVLLVLLCVSVLGAEEQREQPFKPTFSFSANGGKMRGEFTLNGEFLYSQRWKKFMIQTAAMANVNNAIREYGFSGGGTYWLSKNIELGLFFDALYLERVPGYSYGGFHGQIRPELKFFISKRVSLELFYAHPVTRPVFLSQVSASPIFRMDEQFYYYDTTVTKTFAKPVKYAGGELAVVPVKFLKLTAEGIYAFKQNNMYRFRAGAEVKPFNWLTLSIDWTKMHAREAIGLYVGGNYQAIRAGATISWGRSQQYGFSDLAHHDVVTPKYPVVIIKKESLTTTEKIERVKVKLEVDPQEVCLGNPIHYKVTATGGVSPYSYSINFGDGTKSSSSEGDYIYQKVGRYCINATVTDSRGHSASDCVCVSVIDCKKQDFKLIVEWCKGVGGTPEQGIYWYKEGTKVEYSYFLLESYIYLKVKIDGKSSPDSGTILMDKDHYVSVCADKECKPIKITGFTASKTEISVGEEVTLNWTTEGNGSVTLNREAVPLNGSKAVKPSQTTTYALKAFNDCSSDTRQITITVKPCNLCDSVFFHSDGSSTLVRNNFPEGQDISFEFQIYNHSETCSFDVPIRWQIKYQEGSDIITTGERSIGVIPPRTVWEMKFQYDWETKQVTITKLGSGPFTAAGDFDVQCRKVQVKLAIGNCGGL